MRVVNTIRTIGLGIVVTFGSFVALSVADKASKAVGLDATFIPSAQAQAKKQETRKLPGISEKMFKKLAKVEEYASPPEDSGKKPDYPAAFKELSAMEKDCDKCNAYELAQIYFRYAWLYATTEDYANSLKYYDKVIAQSPQIPLSLEMQSLKYMSQLAMQLDQYKRALAYLEKWIAMSTDIPADIYDLKARICYQMDDKKCALVNANKTISMREADGGVAKEVEYNLQRALYIEKEDYKTTAAILEKLIRHYPKKSYWVQLSAVYGMLEKDAAQLGTMETAYLMGGLQKEQALINLAYLYINAGVPYRAAKVLEKGFKDKLVSRNSKNLELLARAWQQSQDIKKAIPVMAEAAKESKTGDLYGNLVGLYLDLDNNKAAVKAGADAFAKGGVKRPGEIHLNVGIAQANLENYQSAINSFKKAKEDKRVQKAAESWLSYVEREYEREKALKAAI